MAPGGDSFQARNPGAADICRRLRAMARLRKSEITHSKGRVNADLACNWKKRVTRVLSPTLSELPRFFKMRGEVGKRSGKVPHDGFSIGDRVATR